MNEEDVFPEECRRCFPRGMKKMFSPRNEEDVFPEE
jgi:hypothetical protein